LQTECHDCIIARHETVKRSTEATVRV